MGMKLKTPQQLAVLMHSSSPTNFVGLPHHPTDDLVHWTEQNPRELMQRLRDSYDKLEAAGLLPDALLLIESAASVTMLNEAELAAGPDI